MLKQKQKSRIQGWESYKAINSVSSERNKEDEIGVSGLRLMYSICRNKPKASKQTIIINGCYNNGYSVHATVYKIYLGSITFSDPPWSGKSLIFIFSWL